MRSWRWLLLLLIALFPINPGCMCSGNGHKQPMPFRASVGDNVINCNCNLSFNYDTCFNNICKSHFSVKLCLPPELNPDTAPPDAGAALLALSNEEFGQRVDAYCRDTVTQLVYHIIQVFNGGWCGYKQPYSPEGGIGESVACFADRLSDDVTVATTRDENICVSPCRQRICDNEENCGQGVQDQWGNIHLDRCRCNQVTMHRCPDDPESYLPTDVFCRPDEE